MTQEEIGNPATDLSAVIKLPSRSLFSLTLTVSMDPAKEDRRIRLHFPDSVGQKWVKGQRWIGGFGWPPLGDK